MHLEIIHQCSLKLIEPSAYNVNQEFATWDWDKLCSPHVFCNDVHKFSTADQQWASDYTVDQQLQQHARHGDINAAWAFLSDGFRKAAQVFTRSSNAHNYKFPPSELTERVRADRNCAFDTSREFYLLHACDRAQD